MLAQRTAFKSWKMKAPVPHLNSPICYFYSEFEGSDQKRFWYVVFLPFLSLWPSDGATFIHIPFVRLKIIQDPWLWKFWVIFK